MPGGGWPRALAEVAAVFLLQLVLFQLAEEIGFTGFLQHHWRDRYHPMKLTLYVALLWALGHLPDHFAEAGWGVEALISAPIIFVVEFVSLFFARPLFVWFYNVTAFSVLLVAIFHASFSGMIDQLLRCVAYRRRTWLVLDLHVAGASIHRTWRLTTRRRDLRSPRNLWAALPIGAPLLAVCSTLFSNGSQPSSASCPKADRGTGLCLQRADELRADRLRRLHAGGVRIVTGN